MKKYKVKKSYSSPGEYIIVNLEAKSGKDRYYSAGYSLVEATKLCNTLNERPETILAELEDGLYSVHKNGSETEPISYNFVKEIPYASDSNDLYEQCRELGYRELEPEDTKGTIYSTKSTCSQHPSAKTTNYSYPVSKPCDRELDARGLPSGTDPYGFNEEDMSGKITTNLFKKSPDNIGIYDPEKLLKIPTKPDTSKPLVHVELPHDNTYKQSYENLVTWVLDTMTNILTKLEQELLTIKQNQQNGN